jgi:hypothetical protein
MVTIEDIGEVREEEKVDRGDLEGEDRGNLGEWWGRSLKTSEWFRKAGKRLERSFLVEKREEGTKEGRKKEKCEKKDLVVFN